MKSEWMSLVNGFAMNGVKLLYFYLFHMVDVKERTV